MEAHMTQRFKKLLCDKDSRNKLLGLLNGKEVVVFCAAEGVSYSLVLGNVNCCRSKDQIQK